MSLVLVEAVIEKTGKSIPLEIEDDSRAEEAIRKLMDAAGLKEESGRQYFLSMLDPMAFPRGDQPLFRFGIRRGSILLLREV